MSERVSPFTWIIHVGRNKRSAAPAGIVMMMGVVRRHVLPEQRKRSRSKLYSVFKVTEKTTVLFTQTPFARFGLPIHE